MRKRKILICGATGFIGRNALERFVEDRAFEVHAVRHKTPVPAALARDRRIRWVKADLRRPEDVRRALRGIDLVIQAAAVTTGSKDIVEAPYHHVTDNAVMNALLFRACHDNGTAGLVFFSCSTMYPVKRAPVREEDFRHEIIPKYFGVGWTKVYNEKMCEFYGGLGRTKYTVIRHSNIYGPYDKYDLERSHVFGATVAKVMAAKDEVVVWGGGTEKRDLLHVDDLMDLVEAVAARQDRPFTLVNAGLGESVSVRALVAKIIAASGKDLRMRFDGARPTVPFSLALDSRKARRLYGWKPKISLDEGIRRTLRWYRESR